MYAFPNATIPGCGCPVPGGASCEHCPDEMPPAFVLSGNFENTPFCSECNCYDEQRYEQVADPESCFYSSPVGCCGAHDNTNLITFTEDRLILKLESFTGASPQYSKPRTAGDTCNQAHTLSKDGADNVCVYPDEITITPAAS
jgi:hypothetical protein